MRVSFVDLLAIQGDGYLHKVNPVSKLVATLILISGIIFTVKLELLISLAVILLFLLFLNKVPLLKQAFIYLYPLLFSLVYGKFILGLPGMMLAVIALRAVSSVMVLLLLITTTPYIKIFGAMSRVLPETLVDVMFLTYRAFFLLAGKLSEIHRAIHLKGGIDCLSFKRKLTSAGTFLSLAFIKAVDLNERNYWMMLLRGYQGGINTSHKEGFAGHDLVPIGVATIFLALVVLW